ncbi:hypothetical protein G9A89_008049 [Geosiphon pyriformis]|nr:hypothetical protein G9A89_008049 [Geosiphon pyriformis]
MSLIKHQVTDLLFAKDTNKHLTSTNSNHTKVAEPENIGANHLRFTKFLLQIPAVTPKEIQLPTWKKTKIESPTNPSYHYTLGSTINITSTDFGTASPWEIMESEEKQEKEKEEFKNQEFTYQNLIPKNLKVETPNLQTQQNLNLKSPEIRTLNIQAPLNQDNPNSGLINQQNLFPVIVIDQPPVEPIQQQYIPLQQSLQQLLQPSQQPNLDPMAYAPIVKLEKFTGEKDDA